MNGTAGSAGEWLPLVACPRQDLAAARRQLHGAVQLPAAAAATLLPAAADDSHTALSWDEDGGALWTEAARQGGRAGIALRTMELLAQRAVRDGAVRRLALAGRSMAEARDWLAGSLGVSALSNLPHGRAGDVPVSPEAAFAGPGPGHDALAAWFHDAALALAALGGERPGFGPVRCRPHHLDIAVLERLETSRSGPARSVGAGMSPGDAVFPMPYFYVLPWPKPDARRLMPLPEGAWYTGSWVGAVLAAHDVLGADPGEQPARVTAFLAAATSAARALLAGDGA